MGKSEYWWCVKRGKTLLAHTAFRRKQDAASIFFDNLGLPDAVLGPKTSIVRIRVEEVRRKK